MDPTVRELEAAGIIDSKFGAVTLLRHRRRAHACLGFIKRVDEPISGSPAGPARATPAGPARAISCMLNRLTC